MLGKGAKTETARLSTKDGLGPVTVVRVQASKLLEAGADMSVEGLQSTSVETGRHHPNGVDHLAETRAATKQLECHLRIRDLAQCVEDPKRLGDTSLRVSIAELRRPHRTTEEFEVTVPYDFEVGRESVDLDGGTRTSGEDQFTFVLAHSLPGIVDDAGAEGKTNISAAGLERVERSFNSPSLAS